MPYYLHLPSEPPESGEPFTDKAQAVAARSRGKTITFVASYDERETWIQRESRRIADGTYTKLPWLDDIGYPQRRYPALANSVTGYGDQTPFYAATDDTLDCYYAASQWHFAHVSLRSDAMIAYTPTEEHGHQDRQVRIRCGRYLDLVAPWLSQTAKDSLCAMIRSMASATYKLARTPEEIRAVYRHGKGFVSCMDARNFDQDDDRNPVSVYGNSDLAVAYLGCLDDDDPRVTARVVVWPDRKLYTRIYGDELIGCLLRADGWTRTDYLAEACIRAISTRHGGFVMPYIDGAESVDLDGQWFVLRADEDGEYHCHETDGTTGGSRYRDCVECGNEFLPDDDESICRTCNENCWTCEWCDNTYYDDGNQHCVQNDRGHDIYICRSCERDLRVRCAECGETFHTCNFSRTERANRSANDLTEVCADCTDDVLARRAEETANAASTEANEEIEPAEVVVVPVAPADTTVEYKVRACELAAVGQVVRIVELDTERTAYYRTVHNATRGHFNCRTSSASDLAPLFTFQVDRDYRVTRLENGFAWLIPVAPVRAFRDIPIGATIRVITIPHHTGVKIDATSIRWNACGSPGHSLCRCNPQTSTSPFTTSPIPADKDYEVIS